MKTTRRSVSIAAAVAPLLAGCGSSGGGGGQGGSGGAQKKDLTFVIVPKVVHPWFDQVNKGAKQQGDMLAQQLGVKVTVDYRAPQKADLAEQNTVLEQAAATHPDGIALDPLDYNGNKQVISEIQKQGIAVVLFDSPAPPGSDLSSVGNNFTEQAEIAAKALLKLIDNKGKVAVMQGVPTAPNHRERYEAHVAFLKKQPGVQVVEGGIDNDSIETAKQQASATLAANPDLAGYLCCDAAGPIGICTAINEAGKKGKVKVAGMDNLVDILQFVKDGTMAMTSSTLPTMQGAQAVMMMWQAAQKLQIPKSIDTGIAVIDKNNVDEWINRVK